MLARTQPWAKQEMTRSGGGGELGRIEIRDRSNWKEAETTTKGEYLVDDAPSRGRV